jgi:hypothetical protein
MASDIDQHKVTMAALAAAKCLPVDFLSDKLGVRELPGVGIPYFDFDGSEIVVKRRIALAAKDGSRWPPGQQLAAYGSWRIQDARRATHLYLVEGETDAWTLWYHGLPALGLPGSGTAKTLLREHVEGLAAVYAVREPGEGGATFVSGVAARLGELGFAGGFYELRMPEGVKDPSELHCKDSDGFKATLQAVVASAQLVPVALPDRTAEPGVGAGFADPLPASQLSAGGGAADWLWRGYIARGSVTLLTSLWKAGKSTLLAHLVNAMGTGEELAGLRVTAGNVLVVSEESAALWAARRDKLGIGDHALFYVRPFLGRPDGLTWLAFMRHLARLVRQRGLGLVCFDTLAALSPCDDENDAAKMLAALTPLHLLAEAGAGVLLSHHPRKGDASEGQASRGSGALPGFVDVILEMRRVRGSRDTRQRELTAYSRFDDTPRELVIELAEDGGGYRSLGSPSQADRQGRWQTVRDLLPGEAPGKTAEELLATWPENLGKPGRRTVEQDLQQGATAGRWSMSGSGKRGDPYRFWSNGNSIRAGIDHIAARIESDGQGEGEWTG